MALANSPLIAVLGRLIGGEWHYLPNGPEDPIQMLHRFNWQLDGHAMVANSFNPSTQPPTQISSDIWYWHPIKKTICSVGVVMFGPQPTIFEYTEVKLDGATLVCDFSTYEDDGQGDFRETWEFTDPDHYSWSLFRRSGNQIEKIRTGKFERRKN